MNNLNTHSLISHRLQDIKNMPLLKITMGISLLCIILLKPSMAEDAPKEIKDTHRVNAEELITLAEAMHDMVLIDARIRGDRKKGYIEDSISLPDIITDCDSLKEIIPTKSTPIMFYCNGVKCGRSVNAIKVAKKCGYTKLYWFRGGFEEWLDKGLPYLQE